MNKREENTAPEDTELLLTLFWRMLSTCFCEFSKSSAENPHRRPAIFSDLYGIYEVKRSVVRMWIFPPTSTYRAKIETSSFFCASLTANMNAPWSLLHLHWLLSPEQETRRSPGRSFLQWLDMVWKGRHAFTASGQVLLANDVQQTQDLAFFFPGYIV